MADVRQQYTDELYNNFGYFATWEPGTIRQIGEVGEMKDNEFIRITNLKNLGIEFNVLTDEVKHDLSYSSKGSVTVTQKLSGTTTPKASSLGELESGFVVEFGKEKAVLLKAIGVSTEQIDDQVALTEAIIKLYNDKKWDKKWTVITELKHAESATIIISNSANSKIEISAKGSVGNTSLNIADAELGLSVVASTGINTEIIGKKNLTPLFRLKGIKTSLFGGNPVVKDRGLGEEADEVAETGSEPDSRDIKDSYNYGKSKKK